MRASVSALSRVMLFLCPQNGQGGPDRDGPPLGAASSEFAPIGAEGGVSEPHRSSPELGAVPAPSRLRAPRFLFGLSLACRLPIERKIAKSTPTSLRPLPAATSSD